MKKSFVHVAFWLKFDSPPKCFTGIRYFAGHKARQSKIQMQRWIFGMLSGGSLHDANGNLVLT
jgi:hypothetical protein